MPIKVLCTINIIKNLDIYNKILLNYAENINVLNSNDIIKNIQFFVDIINKLIKDYYQTIDNINRMLRNTRKNVVKKKKISSNLNYRKPAKIKQFEYG